MNQKIKIASRKSPLAMWQANYVKKKLLELDSNLDIQIIPFVTKGDKILDSPLAKIGGKGLFVKELENAMLDKRADIAVHSMKDVPMQLPDKLFLASILKRHQAHDAFVSNKFKSIKDLAKNAKVGTSSLRRKTQLHLMRPDLQIVDLRGNIHTRLQKLDNDEYDAIILASSGLSRMGMTNRITQNIASHDILPAVGQGALSIESHVDNHKINLLLESLNHKKTQLCVSAERSMNIALNGGCQVPISGYCTLNDGKLTLEGRVLSLDSKQFITAKHSAIADLKSAHELGKKVAHELLNKGADKILESIYI